MGTTWASLSSSLVHNLSYKCGGPQISWSGEGGQVHMVAGAWCWWNRAQCSTNRSSTSSPGRCPCAHKPCWDALSAILPCFFDYPVVRTGWVMHMVLPQNVNPGVLLPAVWLSPLAASSFLLLKRGFKSHWKLYPAYLHSSWLGLVQSLLKSTILKSIGKFFFIVLVWRELGLKAWISTAQMKVAVSWQTLWKEKSRMAFLRTTWLLLTVNIEPCWIEMSFSCPAFNTFPAVSS